jgi:hypothetical protein
MSETRKEVIETANKNVKRFKCGDCLARPLCHALKSKGK